MNDSHPPEDDLFDPREPGKARTIYTVVAVVVVISLLVALGGFAVWEILF